MPTGRKSRKRRSRQRVPRAPAAAPPERAATAPGDRSASASADRSTAALAPASADRSAGPAASADRSASAPPRGYARSRARNEEARAALVPLAPGERPTAVTVGAIAAALLALANLIALVLGYESGDETVSLGSDVVRSAVVTGLLTLVAYGMWKARYWAVLGMQTLLALAIIFASLALVTAISLWGAVLLMIILVASGTLFWFLVKAMARIQMPERPGR